MANIIYHLIFLNLTVPLKFLHKTFLDEKPVLCEDINGTEAVSMITDFSRNIFLIYTERVYNAGENLY